MKEDTRTAEDWVLQIDRSEFGEVCGSRSNIIYEKGTGGPSLETGGSLIKDKKIY
jgi:hypothetical protein